MRRVQEFLDTQHSLGSDGKMHYVNGVKAFDRLAGVEFEDVYLDSKVIHRVLAALEKEKEDTSWNLYLGVYKRLAKWLCDPDDEVCPKVWKKIKFKSIDWEEKLKDKWLTEEEFRLILDVVDHPRDKALYACIIEGALRIGEALGLRIRDCKPARFGTISGYDITVSGKTGTSSFPLVLLAPLLTQWLNVHPQKHDPDAFLWIAKRNNAHFGSLFRHLKEGAVNWSFKRYCVMAGVHRYKDVKDPKTGGTKRVDKVSIHILRHTKITWSAANTEVGLSDEMAKKCFRWSKNSRMYGRYVHALGLDSKKTLLALQGVKEEAAAKPNVLAQLKCVGCGEQNAAGSLYCFKCGWPLDERGVSLLREQREMMEFYARLKLEEELKKKRG